MRFTKTLISAALIAALGTGAAFAQTPAPAASAPTTTAKPAVTAPAAPAKAKASGKERTEKSLACSKDADAKNIHGKERKKFMSACKKA